MFGTHNNRAVNACNTMHEGLLRDLWAEFEERGLNLASVKKDDLNLFMQELTQFRSHTNNGGTTLRARSYPSLAALLQQRQLFYEGNPALMLEFWLSFELVEKGTGSCILEGGRVMLPCFHARDRIPYLRYHLLD